MPDANRPPNTIQKQTALILAVITFGLGFLAGVIFTVYKTGTAAGPVSRQDAHVDDTQRARMLEAEVKTHPANTAAWIQLGHVYFDTDQYEKAIGAYEKARELDPNNADLLTDLGVMFRRSGQFEKAVQVFDQAVRVDPAHEIARLNKGIVLMHDLKDREGAIRIWEELLEINPLFMVSDDQSLDQLVQHYKEDHDKNSSE